jgi:1-acyl-sn-glycerol-3-phosphate acyltransferase
MLFRALLRGLLNAILYFLGARRVTGYENVPASGPFVIVTNHMSAADAPLLYLTFPDMRLRFFAGEKWERHILFGPIMRVVGAIYIKRGEVDRQALREALHALEEGSIFGLAPEGTRSRVRQLIPAKEGAAYLASRAQVPILPVGVVNTDVVFANALRLRRTRLETHIGKPFVLPVGKRAKGRELEAATHLIMVHIANLLPPRYHGAYAGSPALAALQRGEDPWPICLALAGVMQPEPEPAPPAEQP